MIFWINDFFEMFYNIFNNEKLVNFFYKSLILLVSFSLWVFCLNLKIDCIKSWFFIEVYCC